MLKIGSMGTSAIMEMIQDAIARTDGLTGQVICSRDAERAAAFAKKVGVPESCGDYSAMVRRDDLDIIYLASPNCCHVAQALEAMEQGKHVIVEKPLAVTLKEAQLLAEKAREKKVFLLEAITTLFMPAYLIAREKLPQLGQLDTVELTYGQYSSKYDAYLRGENPNIFNPAMQTGALNDMGVYCAHMAVDLFGAPDSVCYRAEHGPNGIDLGGTAELDYGAFTCVLRTSKKDNIGSGICIRGARGEITQQGAINSFAACQGSVDGVSFDTGVLEAANRMEYEMARFRDAIVNGDWAFRDHMLEQSVQVCRILDLAHQNETEA